MLFRAEFINEPTERYPQSHASSIISLPNGDLLAAFFAGSREKALDVADVICRKPSGSEKWTTPEIIHKSEGHSEGNTMFLLDKKGTLWFFFNTMWKGGWTINKIRYKKSIDGGKTWSDPIWFRKPIGWLIRNHAIILKNGEILVPVYSEVLGYKSFVLITNNEGKSWKKYGRVGTTCLQPNVVQLSDDSLLMYCRTAGSGRIFKSTSTDIGRHWSPAEPTQFKNPNAGIDLFRCQSGNFVLVYNDSTTARTPLKVTLSQDEGKTWPYEKILESDPGEYSYPYVAQASNGVLHLVYTFNRKRIKHVEMDEAWIMSKNLKK
jgi:predicted neuraminidase